MKDASRYLTLLLRHKPEREGLTLDEYGWCDVPEILSKLGLTAEGLDRLVKENDKKRFRYNEDRTMIKASQGHSIPIKDDFKRLVPPPVLYHGTTIDNRTKIISGGLRKMRRNHVHLSADKETATQVGMRYAKYRNKLWIVQVQAGLMDSKGHEFYISDNDVWLTDNVPPIYLN